MVLDLTTERGIPLRDVPKLPWIPHRRRGRRLHVSTVHRWCDPGIGGIRLEFTKVGGTRVTTEAALMRFFSRLAVQTDLNPEETEAEKAKEQGRVERELDAASIK